MSQPTLGARVPLYCHDCNTVTPHVVGEQFPRWPNARWTICQECGEEQAQDFGPDPIGPVEGDDLPLSVVIQHAATMVSAAINRAMLSGTRLDRRPLSTVAAWATRGETLAAQVQ